LDHGYIVEECRHDEKEPGCAVEHRLVQDEHVWETSAQFSEGENRDDDQQVSDHTDYPDCQIEHLHVEVCSQRNCGVISSAVIAKVTVLSCGHQTRVTKHEVRRRNE